MLEYISCLCFIMKFSFFYQRFKRVPKKVSIRKKGSERTRHWHSFHGRSMYGEIRSQRNRYLTPTIITIDGVSNNSNLFSYKIFVFSWTFHDPCYLRTIYFKFLLYKWFRVNIWKKILYRDNHSTKRVERNLININKKL